MNTHPYPPRNLERIKAVLDHIQAHPETWDQKHWHCGSAHCLAGHGQIAAGHQPNLDFVCADAREWFSLTSSEADFYFSPFRTLKDLLLLLEPLDANGYDCCGYDRDGFNSRGFDRSGNVRSGFDPSGFDRSGFDRDGYDRNGYSRSGYDYYGFTRDGKRQVRP